MPNSMLPREAWDSHLHCLDPQRFPFKPTRAYTPPPATLERMVRHRQTNKLMLVQASIEDGYEGFLAHLTECRRLYPSITIRGTICCDPELDRLTKEEFEQWHEAGARCIRIHGVYGQFRDQPELVRSQLRALAGSYGVRVLGWSISAQLPLPVWASLRPFLIEDKSMQDTILIADHNGCAGPDDIDTSDFRAFMDLLGSGRLYVKIGALYRRSPDDFLRMEPVIRAMAERTPDRIVWGSDWPHVVTDGGKLQGGDVDAELAALRGWLSEEAWRLMLVDNPQSVLSPNFPGFLSPPGVSELKVLINTPGRSENEATVVPAFVPYRALPEPPVSDGGSGVMATYRGYDPEFARKTEGELLKKIDRRILPLVVLIYLFNYLDRNSITQARVYGLQEDTHLKGAEYQTVISIFSVGYILMQVPSTMLMTKLRPSIYLPSCMIIWAIVSGCTAATHNVGSIMAVRFLLGFVEAPFFPGAIYFLSCWYTKKELGVRTALLVSGILLSNAFAGLISAGILTGMNHTTRLASWRWLFIIEGLATVVVALVAMAFLPDFPATTKWLTEAERIVAQARLAEDAGSENALEDEKVPLPRALIWAAKDVRTWIFACMQMATTATISFSHFFPTLIKEIGFSNNTVVLLLTSPPYVVGFFWAVGWGWWADKRQTRSIPAGVSEGVAILAAILLIAVPESQQWARYAFTFLICCGTYGVYATTYAWLSSTIVQPPAKRAVAIGIANTCANVASLFANYFWLDQYEPTYRVSWGCILAFECLGMACILTLRFLLRRANRRFEELATTMEVNDSVAMQRLDQDSRRAILNGFRYVI
ncbi:MFS general substrate transporter [Aspergillus aculeatinus CBS 121060]|uniref:MFS general substrate transporter n=1 Tax=Aspergillus aculeatinus CBS 121060 TaxID=1448322 RepID=A0ACD1H3E4_9EURO|nr:MFS general substrate transporter [Aspergillus aculeatinus CBS 121060]RAH68083.1 MFS general substrate transporter [Aspergillus aculeatinus CBS 121060]